MDAIALCEERLLSYRIDIGQLTSKQIFRKYLLDGPSPILDNAASFGLREAVCDNFDVEFTDVIIVGSCKLGFSIKPERRYGTFGENSDIDIAVVSQYLFERVWKDAILYARSGAYWEKSGTFFKYIAKGWIRPDKFPSSKEFEFSRHWWQFFEQSTRKGEFSPYKLRAGIYHSWFFLEQYQRICIEQCKLDTEDGHIRDE
jgi:predicted nucleotidyltransferase